MHCHLNSKTVRFHVFKCYTRGAAVLGTPCFLGQVFGRNTSISSSNHPTELQVLLLSHFGVAAEFFCVCLVAKRNVSTN